MLLIFIFYKRHYPLLWQQMYFAGERPMMMDVKKQDDINQLSEGTGCLHLKKRFQYVYIQIIWICT